MPKIIAAAIAFLLVAASFVAANPIPIRGVIEGFYGQPWSHQQRLDLMSFCREHNLNAYIYAPKDDPYHRAQWREPYPADQLERLRELISAADQNGVEFIFAVSPGLDLNYSDADIQSMLDKLSAVYDLGCRRFAVFFDDIKDHNGAAQVQFLNRVNRELVEIHRDVQPLITVPTEYYRLDMIDADGNIKPYTRDFSTAIDQNILVLYTGDGVVVPNIDDQQFDAANQIYDRPLGIWWNYPVNDYMTQKLALAPIEGLPSTAPAIFFNPMSAIELSKISLATAAEFSSDPQHYDPQNAWDNAIDQQFGSLASDMKLFAAHSQHLKNDWADCGRDDCPSLRAEFDRLLNGEDRFDVVDKMLSDTAAAVKRLRKKLPPAVIVECHEQLDQLERIINADRIAVKLLRHHNDRLERKLRDRLAEIDQHSDHALISEMCAYQFIVDVLNVSR